MFFELSSIFDVQGIFLPAETVLSERCRHDYRGCGCLYEYKINRVPEIHGKATESVLPDGAPPVANSHDELITDILQIPSVTVKGRWTNGSSYNRGDSIFIEKNGIKYYFVSSANSNTSLPPNSTWVADTCSLTQAGCRLRWKDISLGFRDNDNNPVVGVLPYGGFAGVNKSR